MLCRNTLVNRILSRAEYTAAEKIKFVKGNAMPVVFNEKEKTFTIHTNNSTYQILIGPYGHLLHLYYGHRTEGSMEYLLTYADRGFSGSPYDAGKDRSYSLDSLPQELPSSGTGDYRSPALIIENADGSCAVDLRYKSHVIRKGKYGLRGLPAVYADEKEAETLEIVAEDPVTKVEVSLLYGVLPYNDIITRAMIIRNGGEGKIYIEKALSATLDFITGKYDLISFNGRHTMERVFQRTPVLHMDQVIGSRRGMSSHEFNPFVILAESNTTEDDGSCYGMMFAYSGGFRAEAGQDQYNGTRVQIGLMEDKFRYPLCPGESFTAPEVIMSFTDRGLSVLSHNYHACIRKHVCRGQFRDKVRPVLINSWEASYFNFTGDLLVELAEEAKKEGIEMLVMDDGWFGTRDDDTQALGDWVPNEEKLGGTLKQLADRINRAGLKFGLWIEPEMVSENSRLYREHPDWALAIPGRKPVLGRDQLVLDFSRKEVVDGIYEQISKVLKSANIEYVKWDYNRCIADVFSFGTGDQGRVLYDYILGLYDFLERLNREFPYILLEGCSGGGGRFDAGMLYYTPQIWCSDNTDAIDRLRIQYGTSFGYPVSCVGSHVSIVPNEQNGRVTPIEVRAAVAMAGSFGYEFSFASISAKERGAMKSQVEHFKENAPLMQNGRYYRLSSPFEDEATAWMMVSEDEKEAYVAAIPTEIHGNMPPVYIRLRGLAKDAFYREKDSGKIYPANALMQTGLPLPHEMGEYNAHIYRFEKI